MKMKSFVATCFFVAGIFFCIKASAQIYTDQLIGFSYIRILDEKTQEREIITFFKPEEGDDGVIRGLKGHSIWDPSVNDFMLFEDELPESFEMIEHETCGNCLTLVFSETKKEYYIQDHELGDFWLQKCTLNSKGDFVPTDQKYLKDIEEGDDEDTEAEVEEEGTGQDAGLSVMTIYAVAAGEYQETGVELFVPYEVSSVYEGDETEDTFEMEKACDGDPSSAWFSGETEESENYPIGEYIIITGMVYSETIWILNGYQQTEEGFSENARIKTMDIYVNDQRVGVIVLLDQMGAQKIVVPDIGRFMNGEAIAIKFVITEVYPGTDYQDVGISEIYTVTN